MSEEKEGAIFELEEMKPYNPPKAKFDSPGVVGEHKCELDEPEVDVFGVEISDKDNFAGARGIIYTLIFMVIIILVGVFI